MAAVVVSKAAPPRLLPPAIKSVDWRSDMGMVVQEIYNPQPMAANATVTLFSGAGSFGGFIPITAGTVQIQDASGNNLLGPVAVSILQFVMGGFVCTGGCKVVLTGGASGTALYAPSIN